MNTHQALLKAQEWVKAPQKDRLGDWYVAVYDGKIWKHHFFTEDSAAWTFFYSSLADIKQQFMTMQQSK
jgi:hypothetical protein